MLEVEDRVLFLRVVHLDSLVVRVELVAGLKEAFVHFFVVSKGPVNALKHPQPDDQSICQARHIHATAKFDLDHTYRVNVAPPISVGLRIKFPRHNWCARSSLRLLSMTPVGLAMVASAWDGTADPGGCLSK